MVYITILIIFNYIEDNKDYYIMEYKIPVSSNEYHKGMLMILNFNLNLSPLEIDIVATLLNYNIEIIDIEAREVIRKVLNKDKFSTNNYVSRLRNKGIFITKPADKKLYLNPAIIEIVKNRKVSFEFQIYDNAHQL